jgi:hypothetical protein
MQTIKNGVLAVIFAGFFFMPSAAGDDIKRIFTLSDEDIMSLDVYENSNPKYDPNVPKIVAQRDVPGPGVEFDIYFPPDNSQKSNYCMTYVSCSNRGTGALVGIDVNNFDAFALKFTLVSIDKRNDSGAGGTLVVGALVNAGYSHAFRPEYLSFDTGGEAISVTKTDAKKISIIGFTVYKASPEGWGPKGNTVTIRIEAAPNAVVP